MNQGLKRALLFLAVAGSGVSLLLLASDDNAPVRGPIVGQSSTRNDSALGLLDPEQGTETQVTLQSITFERTSPVEVQPGIFEERPVTLVTLRNGQPGPDGSLLVEDPVLTFLDEQTGAERGSLRALRGRFEAAGAVAGTHSLDVTSLSAEAFTLEGDVDGQFPLADGSLASLACAELGVDGDLARAPGLVHWTRDALSFRGVDMTWDGLTGLLEFASEARLELPAEGQTPGVELSAEGGLEWHLPLDEQGTGWGLLRGPVVGSSTNGSSLACDDLRLFADASSLQLDGAAEVALLSESGARSSLRADSLTLQNDAERGLGLTEAAGDVVLTLEGEAGAPDTVLSVDRLVSDGDELLSDGPVRIERGTLLLTGSGLRWHEAEQRIELPRDATLAMGPTSDPRYAGARLESPEGLLLWLPAPGSGEDDPRGELRGPITGQLPDGTRLAGRRLSWDGPVGQARLEGQVRLERPDPSGATRAEADLLLLDIDPDGGGGALSLRGSVRAVRSLLDAEDLQLSTERLDLESGRLRAPGPFVAQQGSSRLQARDLDADQVGRVLDMAGPVILDELVGPDEPAGMRLEAAGALRWTLPEQSDDPLMGQGQLTGPLELRTADGWRVRAERLLADGSVSRLELLGDVRADGPAGERLLGEQLVLEGPDGQRRLELPGPVEFLLAGLSGSGRDLSVDEASGQLRLEHDVVLERQSMTDAEVAAMAESMGASEALAAFGVTATGPFEWSLPPGATDAWREGSGRIVGDVRALHSDGHELLTQELVVDGPARALELLGPSRVITTTAEGEAVLDAVDGFQAVFAQDGGLHTLNARGGVSGSTGDPLDGHALSADELLLDRLARTTTLLGSARLERRHGGRVTSLTTGPDGRLQAVSDALDQLVWIDAGGGVELQADDVQGHSDTLVWNLAEDHVVLDGNVSFIAMGAGMRASRIEFWPEQLRWFVPNAVIELAGPDG